MLIALLFSAMLAAEPAVSVVDTYLDTYFRMFPTAATAAGRHDLDGVLEDLSAARRTEWIDFNQRQRQQLLSILDDGTLALDDRLDGETLLAQIDRELHEHTVLKRPERDPLYWTAIIANATVFLLVRDDLPLSERQARARVRARLLPRLARQARATFARADPAVVAPELCRIAAGQMQASSKFYKEGFPLAVGGAGAAEEGEHASTAIGDLATTLEDLARRATGSARLGPLYAATFRVGTGIAEPVASVLARATGDLAATRAEAAAYGRHVWTSLVPNEPAPGDDATLLRRLFARVALDRDTQVQEYFDRWQANVRAIDAFVRQRGIITLPDPLTLIVDRSPSFFIGQSVGGVYPAGPYAPEARTVLFLPMPSDDATAEQRDAFFRDFNRHFNTMIVPHELIPGHYVQLKLAARHPRKVRAVFPDPVYVEGWGTFCERLLLDLGWGGPLPRLAHLKKQLENIARTIVDIRVHTQTMSREEVLHFVKEEALQDDQFASNMWTRALTSSPQITTYYLGYRKVREVYDAARLARGERFDLHTFMDGMMSMGPVALKNYLAKIQRL